MHLMLLSAPVMKKVKWYLQTFGLIADHEIVDVDGFVFKRKRRMPLSESANLPEAQAKRVEPCDKIVEEACVATSRRVRS